MSAMKTTIAIVTGGLALLSGGVSAAPMARATFPGRNGQIAYGLYANSAGEEGPEIFPIGIEAIQPGHPSSRSLQFTHDPVVPSSCIESPSYSADGKLIAFDARWNSKEEEEECGPYPAPPQPLPPAKNIFVMSASGGEVHQLTKEAHVEDSDPAFSPDGEQIAFSRWSHGQTQIDTIDADGSNLHPLTSTSAKREKGYLNPRYSPDGKRIVFDSSKGIEEVNSDGSGRHLLVADRGKYNVGETDFSPNGRSIVFVKSIYRKGWIYRATADGKSARRISPPAAVRGHSCYPLCAASPIFSPDGKQILFVVFEGEASKLAEVPVGGKRRKHVTQIVSRRFDMVRPTWQPLP
jgi:Tol biopolymer transport system component